MKTADFYYDLPEELIAQDPLAERSSSRLMVLDRESGEIQHKIFKEIIDELNPEDCLVINDTKVIPARLHGAKEDTGAHIEVLLLKRKNDSVWETLVRPGKKARPGTRISFGDGLLVGEVIDVVEEGNRLIRGLNMTVYLKRYWINSVKCLCRRISRISFRIKTGIRRSMQNTKAARQRRQPVCILPKSFLMRFRQRGFGLPG